MAVNNTGNVNIKIQGFILIANRISSETFNAKFILIAYLLISYS